MRVEKSSFVYAVSPYKLFAAAYILYLIRYKMYRIRLILYFVRDKMLLVRYIFYLQGGNYASKRQDAEGLEAD